MKDASTVVEEFNEIVNMTTSELKSWIETDESKDAGWTGGDGDGETVGHNSATKIIDILERNPDGVRADKVEEDDLAHMRKVVSYCKRHLAQEGHMVEDKSEEELKASKSYKSLKNWGHDSLKVKHGKKNGKTGNGVKSQNGDEEKDETTESTPRKAETGEKRKAEKPADEDGKDGEKDTDEPETKKLKEDDKEAEKPEDEVSEEQDGQPTPTKKRSEQAKSTEKSDD